MGRSVNVLTHDPTKRMKLETKQNGINEFIVSKKQKLPFVQHSEASDQASAFQ
jgi:hypothetical protein